MKFLHCTVSISVVYDISRIVAISLKENHLTIMEWIQFFPLHFPCVICFLILHLFLTRYLPIARLHYRYSARHTDRLILLSSLI